MRLSTRLAVAMIAHVGLTVAVLAGLNYRLLEMATPSRVTERFREHSRHLAQNVEASTARAPGDVLALRDAVAALGTEPAGVAASATRGGPGGRPSLVSACTATLSSTSLYRRCRVIDAGAPDHQLVRVDRARDGTLAVVPDSGGTEHGDENRELVSETLRVSGRNVYVSPVVADRWPETGDVRKGPVLDVAAPVPSPDGQPTAVVVLSVDLQPAFTAIRNATNPLRPPWLAPLSSREMYVVNEQGEYLEHPDPARELVPGGGARLQDDFPPLQRVAAGPAELGPVFLNDRAGELSALGAASARLAGARLVTIVQDIPHSALVAAGSAALNTTIAGALAAVLAAVVLAILLARSMSRPIVQMTGAVSAFARGDSAAVPSGRSDEIGVLARAFTRMAEDVTAKAAGLRRNAEILDVILSHMADAVLLVDETGKIMFANATARQLLGPAAVPGWNDWTGVYEAYEADGTTLLPIEKWPITGAIKGQNIDNLEMAFRERGTDRLVRITVSGRPVAAAGEAGAGAVLVLRDVTIPRETERLMRDSQKMEAIGQLTGGIAHDFNNMLTVITGTIDILTRGVADRPALAGIARMIEQAAMRGADLTRQLLAFARKQPLQPCETDINALVVETAKLLRPTLGQHVEIDSRLEEGAWHALIDPTQLSSALLNLALNSRDAMPGGGKIMLETANVILDQAYAQANPGVKPGPYVMVAVSDTGSGIPVGLLDKVFEPFFTTKEVGKGTGLGLSMVYGFVKQSDGHIKVTSEVRRGTTIKLFLPRSGPGAALPTKAPSAAVQGGDESILVVEDDPMVRKYVVTQIESLGYVTIASADAAEALAHVEDGVAFDLLFTDIVMPGGMNGYELAEEVLRRRPGIPVLYTSGYAETAILRHGRLDADIAMLHKPYRKADLARKLREVLDARAAPERLVRSA
jgi:signal transduction histidine kinase/ActR/RegA family two-component response regulator